jgi:hypothetical protein
MRPEAKNTCAGEGQQQFNRPTTKGDRVMDESQRVSECGGEGQLVCECPLESLPVLVRPLLSLK